MKKWVFWFIGLQLAISPVLSQSFLQNRYKKPNVLFIFVDDLRPTLGAYGDSKAITPNIDQLANQGTVFNRAYVQQPACAPSRTSLLTGLRPDEVKVTDFVTHFRDTRPEVITLPQMFKKQGYETVGVGKIFHWREGFNDSISWNQERFESNVGWRELYVLPENQTGSKAASTERVEIEDEAYLDGKITREAITALKSFQKNKHRFFLGIGYFKPHLPFTAPERYWDLYDREDFKMIKNPNKPLNAPEIAFHENNELRGYSDIPDIGEGPISEVKKKELRHGYYAAVSFIDAQVGKVLTTLDELGLRENTIIVLWGDHGFHLGEQNLWGKSANFELDAHAPLIISAPGVSLSGMRTDAIVEAIDIYPTIIDLAGVVPTKKLSGKSLKPLLLDPHQEWENVAFNQIPRPYGAGIGNPESLTHMGYSVRTDEWRYKVWYNVKNETFEFPELYSMKNSAIESENLVDKEEYANVKNELHELIKNYTEQ